MVASVDVGCDICSLISLKADVKNELRKHTCVYPSSFWFKRCKNIRKIGGVPLLEFSVFCACEAMAQGYISDVLVSTDSVEYLDLLSQYNIVKDYLRPPDLAGDKSPTVDAVRHALDWCEEKRSKSYDAVLILQPTAPFRTPEHIKDCIELLRANPDATCVAGVKLLEDQHPLRVYKLKKDRILMPFCRELLEPE